MNPFIPVVILLTGVVAMWLMSFASRPLQRLISYVPVLAALFALLWTLALGLQLPAETTLSNWSPEPLFRTGMTLRVDEITWLFMLAILVAALAVFLTGLARPGGPRIGPRTASLLLTAAALTAIQSDNLITLAITWVALDIIYFLSLTILARSEKIESQAVLSLGLNSAATFLVLAAALDTLGRGSDVFVIGQTAVSDRALLLIVLAAAFRLGVFPFHLGLPAEANVRQGVSTLMRLLPAAVALDFMAHMLATSPQLPYGGWLSAAGVIGLFVGASQWWEANDPKQGLSFLVVAHSSLALLIAVWSNGAAALGVLAVGLTLLLGGAAMFLHNGVSDAERHWVVGSIGGAVVLAGLPLTVGYWSLSILVDGLIANGQWVVFLLVVVGQIMLVPSYIRLAFAPGDPLPKSEPIVGVSYFFGLLMPLLFAVVAGLGGGALGARLGVPTPDLFSLDTLPALGTLMVTLLGGVGMWFASQQAVLRERAGAVWSFATTALRLDWLYVALWAIYRYIGRGLRTMAAIIEGEGGVLWTIVVALLVWLLLRG